MIVKSSGVWTPAKALYAKHSDTWTEANLWVKISGSWKMLVPPNAVILYTATSQYSSDISARVANGSGGSTPNLIGYHIRGVDSTPLSTGGSATHNHGVGLVSITSYASHTSIKDSAGFKTAYYISETYHRHSSFYGYHVHPNAESNLLHKYRSFIPVMLGYKIHAGALVMGNASISSSKWTNTSAHNTYFIYLDQVDSYSHAAETHNHGTANVTFPGTFSLKTDPNVWENDYTMYYNHSHTANHAAETVSPSPAYQDVYCHVVSSGGMYFNELPLGSIMLFTTTQLPPGWTAFSTTTYNFRWNSAYTTGGSNSHTHSSTGTTSTSSFSASALMDSYQNLGDWGAYTIPSHTHSYSDLHSSVDASPPYITLYSAIKTS